MEMNLTARCLSVASFVKWRRTSLLEVARNSPSKGHYTPMKNKSSASMERNTLKKSMKTISCDAISILSTQIMPFGKEKSINYYSKVLKNSPLFFKPSQDLPSLRVIRKS